MERLNDLLRAQKTKRSNASAYGSTHTERRTIEGVKLRGSALSESLNDIFVNVGSSTCNKLAADNVTRVRESLFINPVR